MIVTIRWFEALACWMECEECIGEGMTREEAQRYIDNWDESRGSPYRGFDVVERYQTGEVVPG